MRTKYTILTERLREMQEKAAELETYIEWLDMTDCGITCSGCGTLLETEGDFARHFYIKKIDEMNNLLNLGWCPIKDGK